VLPENGRGHTAKSLVMSETLGGLCWPPPSPELDPSERLGHDVTPPFAWVLAATRDELEAHVERLMTP
jgi:hypothetical protein